MLFMHDASGANQNDNYTLLQGGWHNGTWRVAYTFAGIRDWLFEQRKEE